MDGSRVILAAHQGEIHTCPNNTLPAFESAIKFGVDMIETDIHMTKDGELILSHDPTPERFTGIKKPFYEMKMEEVSSIDIGGWFSEKFKGTKVPTVKQLIQLVKPSDVLINWELKMYPGYFGDVAYDAADKLIALIEENGLTERSMMNSFSNKVLEYIKNKYGNKFVIHGEGINNASYRCVDKADIAPQNLFDWCCMWPKEKGVKLLAFRDDFDYCLENGVIPCVLAPDKREDDIEFYRKALEYGVKMFTTNNVFATDKALKELGVR